MAINELKGFKRVILEGSGILSHKTAGFAFDLNAGDLLDASGNIALAIGNRTLRQENGVTALSFANGLVANTELDMGNYRLKNVAAPTVDTDASTKKYVDDSLAAIPVVDLAPYLKKDGSVAIEGTLLPSTDNLFDLGSAVARFNTTYSRVVKGNTFDVQYIRDASTNAKLGFDTANEINAYSNRIVGLAAPTADQDASTKKYVDDQDAATLTAANDYTDAAVAAIPAVDLTPYLLKAGGTMTGSLVVEAVDANITLDVDNNLISVISGTGDQAVEIAAGGLDIFDPTAVDPSVAHIQLDSFSVANPTVTASMSVNDVRHVNAVDGAGFYAAHDSVKWIDDVDGAVIPTLDAHLTTKKYVDDQDAANLTAANDYTDSAIAAIPAVDLSPYLKADGSVPLTASWGVGQGNVITFSEAGGLIASVGANSVYMQNPNTSKSTSISSAFINMNAPAATLTASADYVRSEDATYRGEVARQGIGHTNLTTGEGFSATADGGAMWTVTGGVPGTPSTAAHLTTKKYVDDLAALYILATEKGANNGVATLNSAGKLSASQIPAIAITETFVVANVAARDALVIGTGDGEIQQGDVAVVTDISKSFIYTGSAWQELLTPADAVYSVNGMTGTVVLETDDIAEGAANLYFTDARAKAAAVVNTTAGTETDQAASVSAMKSYVAGEIAAIPAVDLTPYLKKDGSVAIEGTLLPSTDNLFDLGSAVARFNTTYSRVVKGNTFDVQYLRDAGMNAKLGFDTANEINAYSNRITGLAAPMMPSDATTKNYVDANGGFEVIPNSGVDASITKKFVAVTGGSSDQTLILPSTAGLVAGEAFTIANRTGSNNVFVVDSTLAAIATIPFDSVGVFRVNAVSGWARQVQPVFSTLGAGLNLDGTKVTNLAAPTADQDASTKKYVDDSIAAIPAVDLTPYLKKDGSVLVEGDLAPTSSSVNLGNFSNRWGTIYGSSLYVSSVNAGVAATIGGIVVKYDNPPSATGFGPVMRTTSAGDALAIYTVDHTGDDAAASGNLQLETGNKTAGTGNSGNISLKTGSSVGGTRGKVVVDADSLDMSSAKIINLAAPTADTDASTKKYVDDAIAATTAWHKVTVGYADLAAAALTNDGVALSLPANAIVESIMMKHSAAFTGGAVSALTMSMGITGDAMKYTSVFDVFQAPAGGKYQLTSVASAADNFGSAEDIRWFASATGANLNELTAGSLDIWVKYTVLP